MFPIPQHNFREAFPNHPEPDGQPLLDYWRRAFLYPNGDLLAIYEGFGLIKIDKNSHLLWANPLRFHHDLWIDPASGDIWALSRVLRWTGSSVRCVISPCAYKRWCFRQRRCGCSTASS